MTRYLGIDVSTTATKAVLVDGGGKVLGVGRSEYGYDIPHPLWVEQDPVVWWLAAVEAIRSVLSATGTSGTEVAGVGMTGQMHGLVLLDAELFPVRPAILWNDQRTQAECDEIRDRFGRDRLIATTGNDALTGFTAPKVLWVRNNDPDAFARARYLLLPKDYVRLRLTGRCASDKAGASGTILFDLAARDWSPELVEALDIPAEWLPPTHEGPDPAGEITSEAAEATGLRTGTPVMAGAGDQAANAVGVGAVAAGVTALSLGTSGVVFTATSEPAYEPDGRLHAFCHALPQMWHLMGVMLSAAGSLRWFRDVIAQGSTYPEIDTLADDSPPGSRGLIFLPYLTGERTPHPDPLARGAFVGLTVGHRLGDLARAVMEGVAMGLADGVELVRRSVELGEIRVSGGGARSRLWLQIVADVLAAPVHVVGTTESAGHGAALLAATGGGAFESVAAACEAAVSVGEAIEPGAASPRYREIHDTYASLYPTLRDSFVRLGRIEAGPS